MFRNIRNIIVFPVVFCYVAIFVFYYFVMLFLQGYHVENIIQILYVKMNYRLDKLIYRAKWLAPFVYGALILKLIFIFIIK